MPIVDDELKKKTQETASRLFGKGIKMDPPYLRFLPVYHRQALFQNGFDAARKADGCLCHAGGAAGDG
jgi:hypothetical protein